MNSELQLALVKLRFNLETLLTKRKDYSFEKVNGLIEQDIFIIEVIKDFGIKINEKSYQQLKDCYWVDKLLEELNESMQYQLDYWPNSNSGFLYAIHIINNNLGLGSYTADS